MKVSLFQAQVIFRAVEQLCCSVHLQDCRHRVSQRDMSYWVLQLQTDRTDFGLTAKCDDIHYCKCDIIVLFFLIAKKLPYYFKVSSGFMD